MSQISRRGLGQYTLLSIRYLRVAGEGQNNNHYCLLDISEQLERARTIHIIVDQISQISGRRLEHYTLLSIRYLSLVREGQNNTHYCLLEISEQQERARTIHITVYEISQSSRKGLEQQTLLSIRYLRVVGEGQNSTHYCILDISDQQEWARTIHINVYQMSQISRRGLGQYTLLSIRFLRVAGEGQNNKHYCLLDISEQLERARTIHIIVDQISQISGRRLEHYTLLSIRYLRVVGKGQNNTHYCLLDISDQQERSRKIHITVFSISQSSRRGLEQYTLLSIRYLRVVAEGWNNTHCCLLDISGQQEGARTIHIIVYQISQSSRSGLEQYTLLSIRNLTVVGKGQNNRHYCLLDISEQQERARTVHITVYQISQISRRGREQYTLLSIRYLRLVGEGQNNTHYCLLDISEQLERARTIHIIVDQISQISGRRLEHYTLLSIRYLSLVREGQNNTHYCLLDISEQQERARTIHITVYQISQSSRKGLEQQTLLSIRYLRVVGEGQNSTHYCILDISDQQEWARTIHINVYQMSQISRRGLGQYTLLSIRYLRVAGEGQNNKHYCLLDISEQLERARTIHIIVDQISQISGRRLEHYTLLSIRYLRVVGKGQNNTHYCLLDISDQQERSRKIHITVFSISQSSRKGLEQQTLLSIRYLRVVGEGQNNTHYCILDISDQQEWARTIHITCLSDVSDQQELGQDNTHYCLLDISEQQERARTIHITVYQISQSSRRGLEQYTLLSIRYLRSEQQERARTIGLSDISEQYQNIHITVYQISQSSRKGLEQHTLLSIRYLRLVGTVQKDTHYCLFDISEQQARARTIHITVYQISQSSRRGLEQYALLSIRYLRVVGEGQNNTHYCLLDISEQQERDRTIDITVYQVPQISRRGLEQYTLLFIRYLRLVGEGKDNTHYCLLDISEQQERARTINITVNQISQISRRGLEQYTLLSI